MQSVTSDSHYKYALFHLRILKWKKIFRAPGGGGVPNPSNLPPKSDTVYVQERTIEYKSFRNMPWS